MTDEDKLEEATNLLTDFRRNPADPKYVAEGKAAAALREKQEKGEVAHRKKVRDRRQLFRPLAAYGFGPLTFGLIVISVIVAIFSRLGAAPQSIMPLFITDFSLQGGMIAWHPSLPEIRHGELWRLITPIFIHFGVLHILFNMLWLRDLGSMIEDRQNTWVLALLVVVIGGFSNVAQFYYCRARLWRHVRRGVWAARLYLDPGQVRSGLRPCTCIPTTVTMMILWFVACFTPLIPHVANATHTVGLIMGMAWGYLSSLRYR